MLLSHNQTTMVSRPLIGVILVAAACGAPDERRTDAPASPVPPAAEAEIESEPLRQGFTQRPSPDTPGLPPKIAPWLSEEESLRARARWETLAGPERHSAERELLRLVDAWADSPSEESLDRLRSSARRLSGDGLVPHRTIAELYAEYIFPNDVAEADRRYKGRILVLSGTVAPHNMKDFADGFKLVETRPYVHDPLLLATDYELSFVECRLARPDRQRLRDWEPVHFVARVVGKDRSDVLLERCVILPADPR